MCDILLRDPANRLWQLGCTDAGLLRTTLTGIKFPINDPALAAPPSGVWVLTANLNGDVIATKSASPKIPQQLLPLVSPSGLTYKLTADSNGFLHTSFSNTAISDPIPYPVDVTMSKWPVSAGVICPRCNNATITVSGDLSCWCCACQSFVDFEETTILIVLSE